MHLVPGLAEKIDVSRGRTARSRSRCRPDAVWEDGTPVGRGRRRLHDPEDRRPERRLAALQGPLRGPRVGRGARPEDLSRRVPRSPTRIARWPSPCRCCRRAASKGLLFEKAAQNRSPLSNGPYRLQSWKAQESIVLERNPRYAGPAGRFERILFRILPDNAVAYRALLQGALDESWIDASLKARADGDPAFAACCRLVEFYDLDYNYIALERAAAVLRGRAGAARRHDAPRPRRDRPPPLPGVGARDLRALGARISGLRRVGRAASVRPAESGGAPGRGRMAGHERRRDPGPGRARVRLRAARLGRQHDRAPDRRDLRGVARLRGNPRAHPSDRVGELRRAARRGGIRSGIARVERVGSQSGPLSLLGFVAMAAAGLEQRVLSEPRGRPSHAGRAAGAGRGPADCAVPSAASHLPRRRTGGLRRQRHEEVRVSRGASKASRPRHSGSSGSGPGPWPGFAGAGR